MNLTRVRAYHHLRLHDAETWIYLTWIYFYRLTAITQLVHHGMIFVPVGYTFGAGMFETGEVKGVGVPTAPAPSPATGPGCLPS